VSPIICACCSAMASHAPTSNLGAIMEETKFQCVLRIDATCSWVCPACFAKLSPIVRSIVAMFGESASQIDYRNLALGVVGRGWKA